MSVYQRTYRTKAGGVARVKGHTIQFSDHTGEKRRLQTNIEARSVARAFEARVLSLVDHRRAGLQIPDSLGEWLAGIDAETRTSLADWGLIDDARNMALTPLADHLKAWLESLRVTSTCKHHPKTAHSRASKALATSGAVFWGEIDAEKVKKAVFALARTTQTRTHYWRATFQACRWIGEHRLKLGPHASPLEGVRPRIKPTDEEEEFNHPRRALTDAEAAALLEGVKGKVCGMEAEYRRLVYRIALETGLRRNEIRTLTRGSFDLNRINPTVKVKPAKAKSRAARTIPLAPELAGLIQQHLEASRFEPFAPAFPLPQRTALAMQHDLEAVGIAYRDEERGEYADFHSLRHTFGTRLVKQTDLETARALLGHADIRTTAKYLHSNTDEQIRAIQKMPRLGIA